MKAGHANSMPTGAHWVGFLLIALGLVTASSQAVAQTRAQRLDDTGTQALSPRALLDWDPIAPGRQAGLQGLKGQVLVDLRLDTAAWQGHAARIYLSLAPDGDSPVTVEWQAQGRLLAGRVSSGTRALIYSGPVPGPVLQERLQLRMHTGSAWTSDTRQLDFQFEIETD